MKGDPEGDVRSRHMSRYTAGFFRTVCDFPEEMSKEEIEKVIDERLAAAGIHGVSIAFVYDEDEEMVGCEVIQYIVGEPAEADQRALTPLRVAHAAACQMIEMMSAASRKMEPPPPQQQMH